MANNNCDLLWYCFFVCVYDANIDTKERKEIEGYAVAIVKVTAEQERAYEVASGIFSECKRSSASFSI